MTRRHTSERALVALRWDENELGDEASLRLREEVAAVSRQFGMPSPAELRTVESDHQRPGFALLIIEGSPFEIARRGLAAAKRLYENLIATWVLPIRIAADVRVQASRSDAELEQLLDESPLGFVSFGPSLVTRLSDDELKEVAARRSAHGLITYLYPEPLDAAASDFGVLPDIPPRLPHRFVRRGRAPIGEACLTSQGLLDPSAVPEAEPLEAVLRAGRTVLIVGEPWSGKSYCAKALHAAERRARGEERAFLQDLRSGPSSLRHDPGWNAWRASGEEGVLILDGVDEAVFQGLRLEDVLEPVEALTPEERARLRLIVLTRDDEISEQTERALNPSNIFRLLPVDAIEGQRELGDGLERAFGWLASHPDVAPRPVSMEWLRTLADPAIASADEAAARVVERLCIEGIHPDHRIGISNERILRAAERMAAALTLSETDSLEVTPDKLELNVTASRIAGDDADALRAFLRSEALVLRGGTYKFRSRYTQELLAAHGLRGLRVITLRELLTDRSGRLRPELGKVAEEVGRSEPPRAQAIERWRETPLPALPEATALELIERIAGLEQPRIPWGVDPKVLARIDHPSVRGRAKEHLQDRTKSPRVRATMLQLARLLDWREWTDVSLVIARDDEAPASLRIGAAYFVSAFGNAEQVEGLRPLCELGGSDDEELAPLAAIALRALLRDQRLSLLEAASRAPLPRRGLTDERTMLVRELEERLSVQDARSVLGRASGRVENTAPEIPQGIQRKLVPEAIAKVAAADVAWDEELASDLAQSIDSQGLRTAGLEPLLEERLTNDGRARELLYRAMLESRLSYLVRNTLTPDDGGWLLELARSMEEIPTRLAEDLNHLLWWLPENDPARAPIAELLSARLPARWAEWEEARRRAPEERSKWEAARRARAEAQASERRALGSVLHEVRTEVSDPTKRLRLLARLCFTPEWNAFTNVDGSFDALPRELRQEIIDELRSLLPKAEFSELPEGTSFSSTVVEDAAAFGAAVLWDDEVDWLSADIVKSWLPLVLFLHDGDAAEIARRCFDAQREVTLEVAERCVTRDARVSGYPFVARELPAEAWAERRFIAHVLALLADSSLAHEVRERLLLLSASRAPRLHFMPALRQRAASEGELRLAAIAALVSLVPTEGLKLAEAVVADGAMAANALRVFIEYGGELRAPSLDDLSTDDLARLGRMLVRYASFEERPVGEAYSPSDDDHLRDLRSRVIQALGRRPDFDDFEALLAYAPDEETRERIRLSLTWVRDSGALERWLAELEPVTPRPSVKRVIDVLDGARELYMRSVEDLFEVVREDLERNAAKDTPDYQQLLRGTHSRGGRLRDWPNERSLQAYVQLRVREILARSHDHADDLVHREVQEAAGADQPDFVLVSVKTDVAPGETVELPLEVKWSHDDKCIPSLTEQLGRRYVVEKSRTHGLYVVGFTGEQRNTDLAKLRARLETERMTFEREHRVRIGVVVLPCVRGS